MSDPKKYLIIGLGNPGRAYCDTRHNIGFAVLDALSNETPWENLQLAHRCAIRVKNKQAVLIKPQTYMNLSGKAVRYWMNKEEIPLSRTLVIVDDLNLPFGAIRLRAKGNHGGHNGLENIESILETSKYPRLRVGIGNNFKKGDQVNYVLGSWDEAEKELLPKLVKELGNTAKSFILSGLAFAMNKHNTNAGLIAPDTIENISPTK